MLLRASVIITILTLLLVSAKTVVAQADSVSLSSASSDTLFADTLFTSSDSLLTDSLTIADSLFISDSLLADSLAIADTMPPPKRKQAVDEPVFYSSKDSLSIILAEQVVLLWGEGEIKYQDIQVSADFINTNMESQILTAVGNVDTSGNYFGRPVFKKGSEEFEADTINYSIKSGKGVIYNVKSEQGEGYLHSNLTKRDNQGHIHMKGGKYTTCDEDEPHFYMELTKAIAIPNDKIISGPAYLVVEKVPIPLLGLPFGFFPSSQQRGAGVLIPKYSEEKNRGHNLRGGGWYQPLGQYVDMVLTGDIYSKGSWAAHWGTSYKVRYKFSGRSNIDYAENKDNTTSTFVDRQDFKWTWNHRQDPKANPTQTFSANVNFSSSGYDRSNSESYSQTVSGQKSSSISFTKSFPGTPFNLSVSANARQNTQDSTLVMDLPSGSFNASTIYPFRNEGGTGKYKWYENIGLSYNSEFKNHIDIRDTMLFESSTWEEMNYGFAHRIPLSINLKTDKIKMLTISPSFNYSGALNSWYTKKHVEFDGQEQVVVEDTVRSITYAHAINPGITVGLTPKVTGMFLNTRTDPRVIAVRHVMQPRASFNYVPDMGWLNNDYYDTIFYVNNGNLQYERYSYYENNLYKAPTYGEQSGSLSLGLSNSLDMKVRSKNDTIEDAEPEKVSLLRTFNLSTSYNPFASSYKWSVVSLNTSTALFKNLLSINVTSRFDPYDFTSDTSNTGKITYRRVNEFNFDNNNGLVRFVNLSLTASLRLKSKQGGDDKTAEVEQEELQNESLDPFNPDYDFVPGQYSGDYVDFNIPWSLNLSYSYSINRPTVKEEQKITNVINARGDFSLTPKWKIGFNTGYDMEKNEMSMTNFNIHRDLHCWEMRFTVVPFGARKSYSFAINAKSSILRDLKWDKRDSWYDNL